MVVVEDSILHNSICEPGNVVEEHLKTDLRPADSSLVHPAVQSLQFQELDRLEELRYLIHGSERVYQVVVAHLNQI